MSRLEGSKETMQIPRGAFHGMNDRVVSIDEYGIMQMLANTERLSYQLLFP